MKPKTIASLRSPPAIKQRLEQMAEQRNQSLSAGICSLFEEAADQNGSLNRFIDSVLPGKEKENWLISRCKDALDSLQNPDIPDDIWYITIKVKESEGGKRGR